MDAIKWLIEKGVPSGKIPSDDPAELMRIRNEGLTLLKRTSILFAEYKRVADSKEDPTLKGIEAYREGLLNIYKSINGRLTREQKTEAGDKMGWDVDYGSEYAHWFSDWLGRMLGVA